MMFRFRQVSDQQHATPLQSPLEIEHVLAHAAVVQPITRRRQPIPQNDGIRARVPTPRNSRVPGWPQWPVTRDSNCISATPLHGRPKRPLIPVRPNHRKSCPKPSQPRNPNATHPVRRRPTPATRMRYIATEIPTLRPTSTILCQVTPPSANKSSDSPRRTGRPLTRH